MTEFSSLPLEGVRSLIEQWRQKARSMNGVSQRATLLASGYYQCADELEALLLVLRPASDSASVVANPSPAFQAEQRAAQFRVVNGSPSLPLRPAEPTIGQAVKRYMAECMAMPDIETDQEQNWIAGHMATFALSLGLHLRPAEKSAGSRCGKCGQPCAHCATTHFPAPRPGEPEERKK